MLKLNGRVKHIEDKKNASHEHDKLLTISTNILTPNILKINKAFLIRDHNIPGGYKHYFCFESDTDYLSLIPQTASYTLLPNDFKYLKDGDIVKLHTSESRMRVLFRKHSLQNSILVTERCNHYCLMCSQPPKDIDDSWILDEIEQLIKIIPRTTLELGFTGGEPTLIGQRFFALMELCKNWLPETGIHILSNGRRFADASFAVEYAEINHPDMVVGIPLYSSVPEIHDYIVQAKGAFDETIRGILNLKKLKQKVEIRIVLHKQSIPTLIELCEYISRNLLFVDHVALMGLEVIGFTRANIDKLWIDPGEYTDVLSQAISILSKTSINVSIYNHPLCLIKPKDEDYYRKSISDWKNEYAEECNKCTRVSDCGGFFSSGIQHLYSQRLIPFTN